jgi:hypothetical protein
LLCQVLEFTVVQQLESIDHQVFVLYQRDAGAPFFPAIGALSAIELAAYEADDYFAPGFHG